MCDAFCEFGNVNFQQLNDIWMKHEFDSGRPHENTERKFNIVVGSKPRIEQKGVREKVRA